MKVLSGASLKKTFMNLLFSILIAVTTVIQPGVSLAQGVTAHPTLSVLVGKHHIKRTYKHHGHSHKKHHGIKHYHTHRKYHRRSKKNG